jgi:hypothetical protein
VPIATSHNAGMWQSIPIENMSVLSEISKSERPACSGLAYSAVPTSEVFAVTERSPNSESSGLISPAPFCHAQF